MPKSPAMLSFHVPTSRTKSGTERLDQNPPSSSTSTSNPTALALSSRATTERWHRRKFSAPPHSGLLAYWVLQNDCQRQPPSPVRTRRDGVTSTNAG